jgi:hypothetical protein
VPTFPDFIDNFIVPKLKSQLKLSELFPQENFSKGWKSFSKNQGIWEKIFSLNILKLPRCKNLPQKSIDKHQ